MKRFNRFKRLLDNRKGSVLVVLALCMTVLLGGAALVTDIGYNYVVQNRLAVAADAAALAAGTKLGTSSAEITQTALSVAEKNGVPVDRVIVDVDANLNGVTVRTRAPMELFFSRIFNAQGGMMEQQARVAKTRPIAFTKVFPLGIDEAVEINYNVRLNLFGQELLGSGNYGGLQFLYNGQYQSGASVFEENLEKGFPGVVTIGDIANTESGAMMGPVRRATNYRIAQDPNSTVNTFVSDSPRVLIMPIYSEIPSGNQVKQVKIVDFAAFYVESITGQGSNVQIWGYFIRPHVQSAASVEGESDYGLTTIKLVQ